jgi:sortase A
MQGRPELERARRRRRARQDEPRLTRRAFLFVAAGGAIGVGWQAGALNAVGNLFGPGAAPPEAQAAAAEPTATPALPALDPPLAGGAAVPAEVAQSAILPPLPPRESGFVTRTLPPSRLIIPNIDVDSRVIPLGTTHDRNGKLVWETAPFAVGHHEGTANPGEPGNVVLSGHISSPHEGAVFKRLPQVKAGDAVIVATAQQSYLYRVRDTQVVAPSDVQVIQPTTDQIVTILTCVPDGIYSHRLVVKAEAV